MPGTEYFGEEEKKHVNEVLDTGILFRYNHDDLREGIWKAKDLEAEVRSYTDSKYALAVSSGSTAVACCMAASGVGYRDEVIVPPFTYIATIEAVIYGGGIPVFAEVDETLCLSAEGVEKAITPNTKAVLLVHMCGAAADIDGIKAVCDRHDIKLIEDSAQALGAFYKGKHVGKFGTASAFSFDFFKITTAGEGGVFITDDEETYLKADNFSDHGHDHIGDNRGMEQHPYLGFNYRISELHAAVGLAQMQKLGRIRDDKRRNKKIIKDILLEVEGLEFRHMPDPEGDSGTFLNFFLPSKDKAQEAVNKFGENGIGVAYWYTNMFHYINQWGHLKNLKSIAPMAIQELDLPQDYNNLHLPKSEDVISRLISLGIRGTWTEEETRDLGQKMKGVLSSVIG